MIIPKYSGPFTAVIYAESGRATIELGAFYASRPFFHSTRGDGHPVPVLQDLGQEICDMASASGLKQLGMQPMAGNKALILE